ncbi:MAG: methyl-accepting chemotaxis protein [Alphaproteobacteria bacterium]|jgi:methyl-accepting chemotaxis protein|nr:methyl-accepting chemotaxis protein [Alphaproteobacteria bacterium]
MKLSLKSQMRVTYGLILICVAALGALSIDRLASVSSESNTMNTVWTPRSNTAEEMSGAARDYRISEALRILSVSSEMAQHADADLKANSDLFASKLAEYRTLLQNGETAAPLDKVQKLWQQYVAGNEQMLVFAKTGHQAEAADRFRNSASRFYLFDSALNDISDADTEHNSIASATAAYIYQQARLLIFTALGAIALLMSTSAVFFEVKVWRVLVRSSGIMQRLAKGELDTAVEGTSRRDEIGEMARAVQVFKDNAIEMRRLEAETEAQRQTAEETRRKSDEVAAATERQRTFVVASIATGLEALSKGELTFRLSGSFPEEFQKLHDDFNSAMVRLQDAMQLIKTAALGIRAGTDEISQSADDLSRRTEQQAASLEESAAALDQITTAVRRMADGAGEANNAVAASKLDAERSGKVMHQAVGAMNEIEQSAKKISQIISVIDEIAFQTNLLALNAGVEAARAGDAGRGFAVVATEVRALAQRSASAAKEIKALISTSTDQVSVGVQLVGQTGQALDRIVTTIAEISKLVADIATTAKEQASGLHEVNSAIDQMDQVTQQNASMVEESTAASFGLASESQQLAGLIARFKIGDAAEHFLRASAQAPVARAKQRPVPVRNVRSQEAAARKIVPAEAGWEEF